MPVKVRIENRKSLRTRGAVTGAVAEQIKTASDLGFSIATELVAHNSTDTGNLLRSGFQRVLPDGVGREWGFAAPYAVWVERGTAPHWPPIDALKGWSRRVLGDESLAFVVARKIAREGTDPQPFVRPGFLAMTEYLRAVGLVKPLRSKLEFGTYRGTGLGARTRFIGGRPRTGRVSGRRRRRGGRR